MTGAELVELERALRDLAPLEVRCGVALVSTGDPSQLAPVEQVVVERAGEGRRRELAAGRALLRSLMGLEVAVPRGPSGAPAVPAPFVASVAHDAEVVVAVVAVDTAVAALGIDVEPVVSLDAATAAEVLRPDEAGLDAGLAFVLKEASYKAWSSLGGRFLEHHDVRVDAGATEFTATVEPDGTVIRGRWGAVTGRWLALAIVPRPPNSSG